MKTAVIVLYKVKVNDSKTIQSLSKSLLTHKDLNNKIEFIIYDNSPEKQEIDPNLFGDCKLIYVHDERNEGISTAYNYALTVANNTKSKWLLLLDHDTNLTNDYLDMIIDYNEADRHVAAIVPTIYSSGKKISPVFSNTFKPLQDEQPGVGVQSDPVMAINSGSLIKVDFLNKISGFNREFPLDYLDHWLFYEVYKSGYFVNVLNVELEHDLSVMDYNNVSFTRYRSILDSEYTFYKKYKKELYPAYKKQLVKRLLKQFILVKNKKIALYTLKQILLS
ncbi:glycosyltransferase [Metabacillus malikii]|uniref:GT2 family glycosyltransferase n=1 Tax=Metabacillus malikii TaxID=1504265 RepID=A0ABT9ZGM2_9BACI|nr:glycosyltransferase [Metabacillus malikii]MDQ0231433.1 GT2 family glycosyltransferase [Metabacillus malikii]